jgi:nucleoside-diphosphate-sugar epimerase
MALHGEKILVTGPTGQVTEPIVRALAPDNDVWGLARFRDPEAQKRLEAVGITCVQHNLATDAFDDLPEDFTYVINAAAVKSGKWDLDLAANAEAVGLLMAHCRSARAVLHISSTAVYAPNGDRRFTEADPLGDNHRTLMPTYSICKIAAEAVARFGARQWSLPTVIARLNVPYGDNGGWPALHLEQLLAGQAIAVHPSGPSRYNPIHEDDLIRQVPDLLAAASVPATIVNWGGAEPVALEEWCAFLGEQIGVTPRFEPDERALSGVAIDTTRMHELIGPALVPWPEGMRRMLAARHPELV